MEQQEPVRSHRAPSKFPVRFLMVAVIMFVGATAWAIVHHASATPAADPQTLTVVQECQQALGYDARTSADIEWLQQCVSALTPPTVPPTTPPTVPPSGTTSPSTTPTSTAPPTTPPTPTQTTLPPTTTPPPSTTPAPTSPTVTSTPPATSPGTATNCLADPGRCGYPDAASAGAHGTLAAYTGPTTINTAGLVIHDVSIMSCIVVNAPNVTFRNVRFAADCPYVIDTGVKRGGNDAYDVGTTTFDHVTVICTGNSGTAIGEARITALNVDISLCENGFDLDNIITVQDSYIHDLLLNDVAHADGIQVWAGANNVVLRHNTFLVQGDTSAFITGGTDPGLIITDNLLDGGAYTIYCANGTGQLTNNRFGPIGPNHTAPWGHTTDCLNMTRSGNIEDTTGLPALIE
jgi:hypothetical protein